MSRLTFMTVFLCLAITIFGYSDEIDYSSCQTIQSAIEQETKEIEATHPADHAELSQLYVSRGESYLLDAQYQKAIEDFQQVEYHLKNHPTSDQAMIVAFRKAMGEAVSYDNLGMELHTQQAIEQIQSIASYIGCGNCLEDRPCRELEMKARETNTKFAVSTLALQNSLFGSLNGKKLYLVNNTDDYSDIGRPNEPPDQLGAKKL